MWMNKWSYFAEGHRIINTIYDMNASRLQKVCNDSENLPDIQDRVQDVHINNA